MKRSTGFPPLRGGITGGVEPVSGIRAVDDQHGARTLHFKGRG